MKQKNYWKYVKKNIKNYTLNMKISEKKYDDLVTQFNRTRKTINSSERKKNCCSSRFSGNRK